MNLMNNPMTQIVQLLQAGHNPQAIVQVMVQNDPRARQTIQMMSGKTIQQKEQMVRNMCAECGTTVEDLARSMGISIPSNR